MVETGETFDREEFRNGKVVNFSFLYNEGELFWYGNKKDDEKR